MFDVCKFVFVPEEYGSLLNALETGRSLPVNLLNERRLEAVRHRLAGCTLAEAARRASLSVPTVADAMAAFQRGGWPAVPVASRGRKPGQGRQLSGAMLAQTFRTMADAALSPCVWDDRRLMVEWQQRWGVALGPRAVAAYRQGWGLNVLPQGADVLRTTSAAWLMGVHDIIWAGPDGEQHLRCWTARDRRKRLAWGVWAGDLTLAMQELATRWGQPGTPGADAPAAPGGREHPHHARGGGRGENPVMLYSIGKDSAVMLHLARKAFYPAPPPFPLLHVDTPGSSATCTRCASAWPREMGMELLVHHNPEAALGINPFDHGSQVHTDMWKTEGLKQALDQHGFDAAFGGARRDEEKSRAKERIFSFRTAQHRWDPRTSAPSCGASTTCASTRARASACSRCRTGPSSTSGSTSTSRTSRSCRCTSRPSARWSSATAC
jgi:transposase